MVLAAGVSFGDQTSPTRAAKHQATVLMSTEHIPLPEIVTPDMIREAVAASLTLGDEQEERALELLPDEEITAVADAGEEEDADQASEVETAEEVALKNGVYHEIKRKLHERFAIPLDEIAFAHDADTPMKKAALYQAVNQGRVRVLIGSTGKMGTGVNVQKRLIALHHVDQPWKPAELEQREGRILRQGNIYPEVFIFHYVTTKSFDGYMLQTLESKGRFISQIMAGEVTARTAEDVGDLVLSVAQVKAIASGNPLVQRRIELEVKVVKLDRLRAGYYQNRARMREELEQLPSEIEAKRAELLCHQRAMEARHPLSAEAFDIQLRQNIGSEAEEQALMHFDKRERAGAHIRFLADLLVERLRRTPSHRSLTEEIGRYRGFRVCLHASGNARLVQASSLFNWQTEIHLYPEINIGVAAGAHVEEGVTAAAVFYPAQIGESNVGITQSMDWQLRHLEDRVEQTAGMINNLEARLQSLTEEAERPWALTSEYRRLRRAYEEMGAQLQADGIAVEANTTFTAEGAEDETDEEGTPEETTMAVGEEAAAQQNPYTGLEEWNIIVEEMAHDDDITSDTKEERATAGLFDSVGFHSPITHDSEDETDIFLNEPAVAEALQRKTETTVGKDQATGEADLFSDAATIKEEDLTGVLVAAPLPPSKREKKRGRSGKTAGQASFLFD